jgi:hypothetical protein
MSHPPLTSRSKARCGGGTWMWWPSQECRWDAGRRPHWRPRPIFSKYPYWWLRRPDHRLFGRFLIISTEYPASYDEHDVQHEANGSGGEANLGEQRQAVPCRDVERLKHVGHGSSLSFAGNFRKIPPGGRRMSRLLRDVHARRLRDVHTCDSLPPRSRRQQPAGRMIDE